VFLAASSATASQHVYILIAYCAAYTVEQLCCHMLYCLAVSSGDIRDMSYMMSEFSLTTEVIAESYFDGDFNTMTWCHV